MSLYKRPSSSHWWCRFTIRGREIRQSTGTDKRQEAEEYETRLRSRHWRESQLGESFHTFKEAGERWLEETDKRSKDKDEQRITWLNEAMADLPLREIDSDVLTAARKRLVDEGLSKTTVNHYLQVIRGILRKAKDEWGWLDSIPKVPMFKRQLQEPRWLTREQFKKLVRELPEHTADMARFAVATGLRKANITGLTWDRVDLKRGTAFIPSSQAKAGKGIPVALNADAIAVLKKRKGTHETYCFSYQGNKITDVATNAWRVAVTKAGQPGFRFHDLRHTWASWQVQAETPLSVLQDMGGWQSFEMVRRYAHLSPGHLKQYADRTLLKQKRKKA
jgi:integrase